VCSGSLSAESRLRTETGCIRSPSRLWRLRASGDRIELREPERPTSLWRLSSSRTRSDPWRVEGPGCFAGVVSIDAGGCSLCEVCVGVCVTGARRSEPNSAGLCLSIDSGSCTACGACVALPREGGHCDRGRSTELSWRGTSDRGDRIAVECATCGAPLVAVLSQKALRLRLGGSPSALTAGTISVCATAVLAGGLSRRADGWHIRASGFAALTTTLAAPQCQPSRAPSAASTSSIQVRPTSGREAPRGHRGGDDVPISSGCRPACSARRTFDRTAPSDIAPKAMPSLTRRLVRSSSGRAFSDRARAPRSAQLGDSSRKRE